MSYSDAETHVLARFSEKSRIAGGPKAGYNLRQRSIEQGWEASRGAVADGVDSLVSKGLLASNDAGDRLSLTEQGVEALESW